MSARIAAHLRSNVVAYLVLFLAVTVVPVYAAGLKKNSVKSKQIKDGQVKAVDADATQIQLRVGGSCQPGAAIRAINQDGTVSCESDDQGGAPSGPAGGDLTGTYPAPQIAGGAVTAAKLADGAALTEIADDDGTGSGLDADTLDGVQGSGFVGTTAAHGGDVTGTFDNLQLASGSVGQSEIATNGVGAGELLASDEVTVDPPSLDPGACTTATDAPGPAMSLDDMTLLFASGGSSSLDLRAARPSLGPNPDEVQISICNTNDAAVDSGAVTIEYVVIDR